MKNHIICTWVLLILALVSYAQKGKDTLLLKKMDIYGQNITADALGDFYVMDVNVLSRYDTNGKLLFTHSNLSDGTFTSVDVSDPLKILLFSREFGHIRFLDNTLSTKGDVIPVSGLGFMNASLVCTSYESGLWIYDPVSIQLVRFDNNLNAVQFSGNIAQLAGFEVHPGFLMEYDNMVYLGDTNQGILVFDRYGAYLKTLPFKGVHSLQIAGETLFMNLGNEIWAYDMKLKQEQKLKLPLKGSLSACLSHGRLYMITAEKLYIYSIE
jgi:hypothetical protein